MSVEADAIPGLLIVKSGTVDGQDVLDHNKPVAEIYTKRRPTWCTAFESAAQKETA